MTSAALSSLALIHARLGEWVEVSLEHGFEEHPLERNYARDLITMVDMMIEIEEKMKGIN